MTDAEPAPTAFYPVSLEVAGRACLVVGGGRIAARKARTLVDCGALVTVIAPALAPEMEALADRLAAVERRAYASGDAALFRLVVTATGRPDVDGAVHHDAEEAGIWVNSADDRAHSSFILPAVHRDGAVTVAVSTGGVSPAFASWLRDRLAAECGEHAGALAALIGEARETLRRVGRPSDSVDWAALLDGPLPDLVRAGDWDNAQAIVASAIAE
ncbi:MAG TPA: bifunctional precorrin-2 dehydrogenase/sirohydrochlorin ferrochelatase [Acidimicrobiales bacterium]|jgi:siroheme synthase-like protein|nr:bifunctional precorrin-2 dehydrogenase/sirohydrochlorin ferrochelatase [Acidimicrobiales bacterium]